MAISSPGIGSGLDVNGIVTKLMAIEQVPLTLLATKEASFQAKLSAYGSLNGALSAFQSSVGLLNDPAKFQAYKASVSDSTIATASAASNAAAGSYAINVSKIAQPQSLVAAGQASATTAIGAGAATTLTFDFGTIAGGTFTAYDPQTGLGGTYSGASFTSNGNGSKTVTIDSTNNTLVGIRDAINTAGIGVTASIINDGSASPYRLVLSSSNAGKSNSLNVSVAGDATLAGLLGQNPGGLPAGQNLQETISAQNAEMTINGVFVSKASSTVTDAIKGITLTALKAGSINLSVAQDTAAVGDAVSGFVKSYNELNTTIKNLTAYDATNQKSGVLIGAATTRTIQAQIRGLLGHPISGSGAYSTLAQVGISFQRDGSMALDTGKLQTALASNPGDVVGLFTSGSKVSDSLVTYSASTSKTQPGNYALTVSQIATQGNLVGSAAAGLTITSGSNDTLNVTVDGVSASVTLAAKNYTASELALEVQSKINGASALIAAGVSIKVVQSGGILTMTSDRYGSTSAVSLGGNGASNLLGVSPVATAGLDVAGTINGVTATGSGQYLTGASGSSVDGLKLLISGGATGNRGTVGFSQGYAYRLNNLITSLLGSSGPLTSATDGINRSIKDIGNRRDVLNRRLVDIEARYRKQFTTLDTMVANLNQTSTYLTQQLANLPKVA